MSTFVDHSSKMMVVVVVLEKSSEEIAENVGSVIVRVFEMERLDQADLGSYGHS